MRGFSTDYGEPTALYIFSIKLTGGEGEGCSRMIVSDTVSDSVSVTLQYIISLMGNLVRLLCSSSVVVIANLVTIKITRAVAELRQTPR